MTKTILAAAALASLIAPALGAQEMRLRYQPEPAFESIVNETLIPLHAKDAFVGTAECAIADAKTIRAYTLPEAVSVLQPCMRKLSARYGAVVKAQAGVVGISPNGRGAVMGLVLRTQSSLPLGNSMLMDLNHTLSLRNNTLLGFKAVVRRPGDVQLESLSQSAAQDALDRCLLPMVVRKIESGADFIRYYGGCLTKDQSLKIQEIRPAEGHPMGVALVSLAAKPTVDSLNGTVSVNAENGPVSILVLAYPETIYLP